MRIIIIVKFYLFVWRRTRLWMKSNEVPTLTLYTYILLDGVKKKKNLLRSVAAELYTEFVSGYAEENGLWGFFFPVLLCVGFYFIILVFSLSRFFTSSSSSSSSVRSRIAFARAACSPRTDGLPTYRLVRVHVQIQRAHTHNVHPWQRFAG